VARADGRARARSQKTRQNGTPPKIWRDRRCRKKAEGGQGVGSATGASQATAAQEQKQKQKPGSAEQLRSASRNFLATLRTRVRDGSSPPMRASRPLRTTLRTTHLLAFGALYGGHVFDIAPERLLPALAAVLASGGAFMLFEIWRAPIWLVQVRGVATYAKLGLLLSVPAFWAERVWILSAIVVIGTVVSHMPSRYRYYSLLHRRVMNGGEKG